MVETYTPSLMQLTDGAVHKILSLKDVESDQDSTNLRVYVTGGGCSGFQYDIKLEDNQYEDDTVFNKNGAKVVIDSVSLKFLAGATIDFSDELIGAKFTIQNPNATSSCGCGTSFSV